MGDKKGLLGEEIKFSEHLKKATNSKKLKYSCTIFRYNISSQIVALKAGFMLNKIIGEKNFYKAIKAANGILMVEEERFEPSVQVSLHGHLATPCINIRV